MMKRRFSFPKECNAPCVCYSGLARSPVRIIWPVPQPEQGLLRMHVPKKLRVK